MSKKNNQRRNRFGSRKKGEISLKYLKRTYENTKRHSPYDSAKELIEKNIPEPLKGLVNILARVVARLTKKGELGLACEMIGMLVVYETRSIGYEIEDLRDKTVRSAGKRGTVWVRRDFSSNKNVFRIEKYNITCPEQKIENMLLNKYGLNVKLGSSPKDESFFVLMSQYR